jgi:glutathione S-transferase
VLLEELREAVGAEVDRVVEMKVLDFKGGEHKSPAFLAVNPMGKVPALRHGAAIVTEQAAVYMYLAEQFPAAGLSPALGDALRGPYLRWMVFYGSCFEPAVVDRSMKRDPAPPSTSPYGTFDNVMEAITGQLAHGPWWLGERYTAADALWGSALNWITRFKLVPELPVIAAYLARWSARPAVQRAQAADAALAASFEKG